MNKEDYNKAYRAGEPIIPDEVFDALPGEETIDDDDGGEDYKLPVPFKSLDKIFDLTDMQAWVDKRKLDVVAVQPKLDGMSAGLHYKDGKLVAFFTRGNGTVGKRIPLSKLELFEFPIPTEIDTKGDVVVRGEIILRKENHKLITPGPDGKIAPRNVVVGLIKGTHDKSWNGKLSFVTFQFVADGVKNIDQQMAALEKNGFRLVPSQNVLLARDTTSAESAHADTLESALDYETWKNVTPFDTDGLVVKDTENRDFGETEHHPLNAVAFKFRKGGVVTTLESITLQLSRNGAITPVAELKPVVLDGVEISRATLHNAKFVEDLNIAPGDEVEVVRNGDVIPGILRLVTKHATAPWTLEAALKREGTIAEKRGAFWYVVKPNAVQQREMSIAAAEHFFSKDAAEAKGVSRETLRAIYAAVYRDGITRDALKELHDHVDADYAAREGAKAAFHALYDVAFEDNLVPDGPPPPWFAATVPASTIKGIWPGDKGENVVEAFNKAKEATIDRVIYGLGIRLIGHSASKIVGAVIGSQFVKFWEEECDLTLLSNALANAGLKPAQLSEFMAYYRKDPRVFQMLEYEGFLLTPPSVETKDTSKPEQGDIVFTGTLSIPRSEAEALAAKAGYTPKSSVTKTTKLVVVGDNAGSKLAKAKAAGIRIMSEREFMDSLQN
jgi:DNA ligase (NAD+)